MQMVIGTHALFQADVVFKNMVLVIIDEQHKFGLHQRLTLHKKGVFDNKDTHQLIMTVDSVLGVYLNRRIRSTALKIRPFYYKNNYLN
jgi:hypothetical protein